MMPDIPRSRSDAKRTAKRGTRKTKRGIVWFVTWGKFIQALLTGSVIGAITSFGEGLSIYIRILVNEATGLYVPAKLYLAVLLVGLFFWALWADNNTEEWRDMVEDVTGEEAADDDPDAAEDG